MLNVPTMEKLKELRFHGMALALEEQLSSSSYDELSFQERLGLLVDREMTDRENRRLTSRLNFVSRLRWKTSTTNTPGASIDHS